MKKLSLIGIVLLIALTGVLVGCSCEKEGESSTAGTIQIPEGPKIKVIHVDFPEGLELTWEKLGMEGFQLDLIGTFKNVSSQTINFGIVFLLDGERIGIWPQLSGSRILGPGEEIRFKKGMVGYSQTSKILEVKVVNFQIIGGSTETPEEPTPEESTVPEPTTPAQPEVPKPIIPEPDKPSEPESPRVSETFFTKAPSNPQTPGEVVAAFYFLWNQEKYNEAIKLGRKDANVSPNDLKTHREDVFNGRQLKGVEIEYVDMVDEHTSACRTILHFTDGSTKSSRPNLIKEGDRWVLK